MKRYISYNSDQFQANKRPMCIGDLPVKKVLRMLIIKIYTFGTKQRS